MIETAADPEKAATKRPKLTVLKINGTVLTNITDVQILDDGRIVVHHGAGLLVEQKEQYPLPFLESWDVTQQRDATPRDKQKLEHRDRLLAARDTTLNNFTNGLVGFADFRPLVIELVGVGGMR